MLGWAGLCWAGLVLDLGWKVNDPLVVTMAGKDRRAAKVGREQATPYTQEVVTRLKEFHAKATGAEKFAAGFALTQAMGVLRFSDLDRTRGMQANEDTLFGTTWRSNTKQEGMPWAMPRHTWDGYDIGGEHLQNVSDMIGDDRDRSWQWPAMQVVNGKTMTKG